MHKVAEEHGVGYVTVGRWKKKRSEIKKSGGLSEL
jgi:hypothetical protein